MTSAIPTSVLVGCVVLLSARGVGAQDWPQWRGANRDAKATGFQPPATWPKQLSQKWKVTVGDGVATPALVGDRLYVFTRQVKEEVLRFVDAATGKELWQDRYEAPAVTGPAGSFPGPRSSPTVAEGKVVTLGVAGTLSCLDAATGKKLWRKDDFKGWPRFFTSSSPLVVDGLCIAQLGGEQQGRGGIVAYDLTTGDEKWKWTDDGTAYASPVLLTVDGTKLVVAQTAAKMVALRAAGDKLAWEAPFPLQGRVYNAATPIVDGQTIIYTGEGRGTKAVKIEKAGDGFAAKEVWSSGKDVKFNTPVLKDGLLYGLSPSNELFCLNAQTGQTLWTAPAGQAGGGGGRGRAAGYGSIVDAGAVLLALTPGSELIVFRPSDKAYTELARIKVADSPTYAYPVVAGNRLFVKDRDSVTLWTIE